MPRDLTHVCSVALRHTRTPAGQHGRRGYLVETPERGREKQRARPRPRAWDCSPLLAFPSSPRSEASSPFYRIEKLRHGEAEVGGGDMPFLPRWPPLGPALTDSCHGVLPKPTPSFSTGSGF